MADIEPDGKLVISEEDLAEVDEPTAAMPAVSPAPTVSPKSAKGKKTKAAGAGPQDPPQTTDASWHQRNRKALLIGLGGVIALALGFLVAFVVLGLLDSSEAKVSDSLVDANESMTDSFADVQDATNASRQYTSLKEAASSADDQLSKVKKAESDLRGSVDDGALANPALELLADEQQYLAEFSTIANIQDEDIGPEWRDLRPRLRQIQRDIEADGDAVEELGLSSSQPVVPEARQLTRTIDATGLILTKTDKVLSDWREQVQKIQEQQDVEVSAAESYKSQMSALIDQYFEQRNETRALMERSAVLWTEAEDALRSQAAARQGIIDQMNALSPPAAAASAHSQMVGLANESRTLLTNAADTTASDRYLIWTGTPGYNTLSQGSDSISSRFEPAKQAVLSAADTAIQQAQQSGDLPPKPKV